jgi:hypothetical protein
MGTPPASGSWDQMRRIQISARGRGECALHSVLKKACDSVAAGMTSATAAVVDKAVTFC